MNSAGKPDGVDVSPEASKGKDGGSSASGGGASMSGGSSINGDGSGEVRSDAVATLGEPRIGTGTVKDGGMFRLNPNAPPSVQTGVQVGPDGTTSLVRFTAKMSVSDAGAGKKGKKKERRKTALIDANGAGLDPQAIPYIVLPNDFGAAHPTVGLGDYVAVTYGSKTLYAIVGDKGPPGVIGEGSPVLARALGMNDDGVGGNVQYLIIPRSRDEEPPSGAAAIQERGKAVFEKAKILVK